MHRPEANAPFQSPFVATVSMRVLNWGRLDSRMNDGWKFHTAGSSRRTNSPVSDFARSRTMGTMSVGARLKRGSHSGKSSSASKTSVRSVTFCETTNLPHMRPAWHGPPTSCPEDSGGRPAAVRGEHHAVDVHAVVREQEGDR